MTKWTDTNSLFNLIQMAPSVKMIMNTFKLQTQYLLNIMFRNLIILTYLLCIVGVSCKNEKNSNMPDNAINPSVIDNPATASSTKKKEDNVPVFKFDNDIHDFGKMVEGEKVSFAFRFKNVGKGDLVIRAAQGSCGCTVPEYPKEPVKPGIEGIINVTFDSDGKEGFQEKTITLISNTMPNTYVLTITGNVEKAGK